MYISVDWVKKCTRGAPVINYGETVARDLRGANGNRSNRAGKPDPPRDKAVFSLVVLYLTIYYIKNATVKKLATFKSPRYKQKIIIVDEKTHNRLLW